MPRVSARVSDELAEQLEEIADGKPKSEIVRKGLRQIVEADDDPEPTDEALKLLRKRFGTGSVELNAVESTLASEMNMPKQSIRPTILSPLRRSGQIAVIQQIHTSHVVIRDD